MEKTPVLPCKTGKLGSIKTDKKQRDVRKKRVKSVQKEGKIHEVVEMHKEKINVRAVFVQPSKFAICVPEIAKNG